MPFDCSPQIPQFELNDGDHNKVTSPCLTNACNYEYDTKEDVIMVFKTLEVG